MSGGITDQFWNNHLSPDCWRKSSRFCVSTAMNWWQNSSLRIDNFTAPRLRWRRCSMICYKQWIEDTLSLPSVFLIWPPHSTPLRLAATQALPAVWVAWHRVLDWFRSYLSERTFRVVLRDSTVRHEPYTVYGAWRTVLSLSTTRKVISDRYVRNQSSTRCHATQTAAEAWVAAGLDGIHRVLLPARISSRSVVVHCVHSGPSGHSGAEKHDVSLHAFADTQTYLHRHHVDMPV